MVKKASVNPKLQTAQDFVNVADIADNLIYTKDGYVYGFLVVRGANDKLMTESDKKRFYEQVSIAFEIEEQPFQIISVPKTIDITNILNNLLKLKNKADKDAKLMLINGEIEFMKNMVLEDIKEPMRIIKVWEKLGKNPDTKSIHQKLCKFQSNLMSARVSASIMTNSEISNLCKIFSELNVYQEIDEDEQFTVIDKKSKNKAIKVNSDLLNMITPVGGISFDVSKFVIGPTVAKVYSAVKFPRSFDYGWLTEIMNSTRAITCLTFTPVNAGDFADKLSKTINRNIGEAYATKDHRVRKKYMNQADDADEMIAEIDEKNNAIGLFSIITMPFGESEETLAESCRHTETLFRRKKIKIKCIGNLQKEAFKALSPYHTMQGVVDDISNRPFMLSTLSGGSPTLIDTFKDENGMYLATTSDGNKVILDFGFRGEDRTNANFIVTGKSGVGKSTAVKSIIEMYYMLGARIIIIDPESEYKDLCHRLGGSWFNAGGGGTKINILQIRPVPLDDEEENTEIKDKSSHIPDMALHIGTLEIFFKLYKPSLTDLHIANLKHTLIELYNKKNIFWDTDVSKLTNSDFPTMSELCELLKAKSKKDSDFKELEAMLYDIGEGADSFIWNGHTNVQTDNQLIVYDTNRLNNASDEVKSAQYFNLLSDAWRIMSENREQLTVLICDEAYLLVDENAPQAVKFLRNIEKRCRKYEGVLGLITHAVVDFLGEKVAIYGQALVDMPTYKFIFGTDAKNLKDIVNLFNLSQPEADVVAACQQRHAIAVIGSQKMHIKFDLPQYRLDVMGKGGGR